MKALLIATFLFISTLNFAVAQAEISASASGTNSMRSSNECFGIKGKPFSTYEYFYFEADGIAYGLKNGVKTKLNYPETLKKVNDDGSIDYNVSLQNFKTANKISAELCNSNLNQIDTTQGTPSTRPPVSPSSTNGTDCHTKGEIDSVVFAMSWQPAFCEVKGNKPECRLSQFLSDDSFQGNNFTLHGLWPNKNSCGQNYGFCGDVKSNENNFCNYPEVAMPSHSIELELGHVMPSKAAGSCLDRHEWHKHGTCQNLDSSQYFDRAIKLLKNFNESKTGDLIRKYINKSNLKKAELLKSLDESFGEGSSKQFILICKGKNLTEIQVNLTSSSLDPKTDDASLTIKSLLNKSSKGYIRNCREEIAINRIGPG